jgi:hypothetical protein
LNVRTQSRLLLTNAFSKKVANHAHAMVLHFLHYHFVLIQQTLKLRPACPQAGAMAFGEMKDVVAMLEPWEVRN